MQECAEAPEGSATCSSSKRGLYSRLPAPVAEKFDRIKTDSSQDDEDFLLPGETHGVVIDDS
jgi:hypothetical protein